MSEKNYTNDEQAIVEGLLKFIGEDPKREGLLETPRRVLRSFQELTSGYKQDPGDILSKTFKDSCNEMVVVRDIQFWSLCEHHMLPFRGSVTVGYIPNGKIVGLSKISRLVQCFASRLQVQERMTQQIANNMMEHLKPQGVGVIVSAHHSCMEMRGVKTSGEMMTSCLLGTFLDSATRSEFLALRN
jgi:GTP cyclohydrolase I